MARLNAARPGLPAGLIERGQRPIPEFCSASLYHTLARANTFVQVLYLESMRLRTRDLPSPQFFKETLEDKLGMKTEDGASAFSLVKHTLLAMLGILYFAWFSEGAPWHAGVFWQAVVAVIVTMITVAFALTQLLYRRTSGHWLLPLVPLLRLIALVTRPFVVMLAFFQS